MKGGGGEEWNTRATGVQRRGIVTTWQSSLSLSHSIFGYRRFFDVQMDSKSG